MSDTSDLLTLTPAGGPDDNRTYGKTTDQEVFPKEYLRSAVTFHVCLATRLQESVRLVGSLPELGNWQVSKGVEMMTNEKSYPCWTTKAPVLLPLGSPVQYKYVICGPFTQQWESRVSNRVVIPAGVTMMVEDDNGFGRQHFLGGLQANGALSTILPNRETAVQSTPKSSSCVVPHDAVPRSSERAEPACNATQSATGGRDSSDCRTPTTTGNTAADVAAASVGPGRRDPSETVKELQSCYTYMDPLNPNTTVVIASFELPLRVVRTPSGDLAVEKLKSLVMPQLHALRHELRCRVKFIGWSGIVVPPEEEQRVEELLEPYDCVPVHLTQESLDMFLSFCHQCLWPLFHSVIALQSYDKRPFNSQQWAWYQNVNRQFAETVAGEAHETDLIWIHDYYLLLVPQFITRRIRKANVGLFLHIPFPSSEIFRCLPVREEILRGMLCADLVGFHFFEYARHFLVANKRLLGLDHHFRIGGFLELDYGGRNVTIGIGHVHVQYEELRKTVEASDHVKKHAAKIRQKYQGRFMFVSVDRCERLAGIILKLRGFQHFLRNYPYASSHAVLVQYVYPTVYSWDDQDEYFKELESLAAELNSEFSGPSGAPVVVLKMRSIYPEKKYALLQCAGCLLDTSVRDGLNLTPFEYICCRKDDPAPLILSEFTGCCRTLASAMRVNPWKSQDVAQVMDRAMSFRTDELQDAFLRDQTYLQRNSTLQWATEFLLDLHRARKKEDLVYVSWGFGTGYRVYGVDSQFQHLNCEAVIQSFKDAKAPVLFFDHEGTLAPDRRRIRSVPGHEALTATGSAPSPQIREYIKVLCSTGTTVVILSGRNRTFLEEWFGGIPGLGLCAEHGFHYKVPQLSESDWKPLLPSASTKDFTWTDIAMKLMKQYVKRTQGAFIENKGSALVFQYRDADPDFGSWQAKELSNYLEELLFGCPVTVMSGKGYVEVKLRGVSKGQAVATLLEKLAAVRGPNTPAIDFVLCIGDDRSDEDMFPVVNNLFDEQSASDASQACGPNGLATGDKHCGASRSALHKAMADSQPTNLSLCSERSHPLLSGKIHHSAVDLPDATNAVRSTPLEVHGSSPSETSQACEAYSRPGLPKTALPVSFSVTVGKKPSNAKYYLNDIEEVSDLLQALSQHADKRREA